MTRLSGINPLYDSLCNDEMADPGGLQGALDQIYGLRPKGHGEEDLDKMSEEELLSLADSMGSYKNLGLEQMQAKLDSIRGIVHQARGGGDAGGKGLKAINALRARMKLLLRQQQSSNWRGQMVRCDCKPARAGASAGSISLPARLTRVCALAGTAVAATTAAGVIAAPTAKPPA